MIDNRNTVILIPARMASTRLPGKPLADINGLPMIVQCWKRAMEVLPAVLVAGACFAVTQFFTSNYVNPYLPDITSAVVTIVGLGAFLKVWKPENTWHFPDEKPAAGGKVQLKYSAGEVIRAWGPYLILAVFVIALIIVFLVARSLIRPLRTLRDSALRVAHTDLEQEIARVRAGDDGDRSGAGGGQAVSEDRPWLERYRPCRTQ